MKAKFIRRYVWYEKRYKAGDVADLPQGIYDYLLADDAIEPAEVAVEQPEAPERVKPVATVKEPLPKHLGVKIPRKYKK